MQPAPASLAPDQGVVFIRLHRHPSQSRGQSAPASSSAHNARGAEAREGSARLDLHQTPAWGTAYRPLHAAGWPGSTCEMMMNSADPTLLEAVRANPLCTGLDASQRAVLSTRLRLEAVQAAQLLAEEGQDDSRLFVIVQGSLCIVKHRGTPDETVLATLKPGDFAHELGFLNGAPRHASLVGASDGQVLVLEREHLESLIDTHPRILHAVMCAIVRTVQRVQTRLSVQSSELTNYIVKQHGRH